MSSFLQLRDEERDGIVRLAQGVGRAGRRRGLRDGAAAGSSRRRPVRAWPSRRCTRTGPTISGDVLTARGRAEERYFGGHPPSEQALTAFGEAAESLVGRWTDNRHAS